MTESADVVVIGDGLAGRMAALAAAERTGSVLLVSRSNTSPTIATGTIDVLGYLPDGTGPIARPFDHLDALRSDHPYRIVDEDGLRDALETFDSIVGSDFGGERSDRNGLVPTQLGTPKPTLRYPKSVEAGLLSRPDDMLLIGFRGLPGIDGEFVASSLSRLDVPSEVRGTNVDLDLARFEQPRLRLARALDRNERVGKDDRPIRGVLSESIAERHEDETRIGLPAVLGREHTSDILSRLEDDLDASVFEYLTDPPSIAGSRLLDRLDDELERRGVERIDGGERIGGPWHIGKGERIDDGERTDGGERTGGGETIEGGETTEGGETIDFTATANTITEIQGESIPSRVRADQFVLATGGLLDGGIVERDGAFVEPVFDLPVDTPGDVTAWTDPDPLASQPFEKAGIVVDEHFDVMQ
ncbi:MAG: FAD-binding protein, partial [Halodesulfurarchaeum sp.]